MLVFEDGVVYQWYEDVQYDNSRYIIYLGDTVCVFDWQYRFRNNHKEEYMNWRSRWRKTDIDPNKLLTDDLKIRFL